VWKLKNNSTTSRQTGDEIQGYYFSPPLPADALTKLLQEGRDLSCSAKFSLLASCRVKNSYTDCTIFLDAKKQVRKICYNVKAIGATSNGFSSYVDKKVVDGYYKRYCSGNCFVFEGAPTEF